MASNESVITKGEIICDVIDVKGDGPDYEFKEARIKLQEGTVALGKPITKAAADRMIQDQIDELKNISGGDPAKYGDQIIAVQFGKEELLYLLSILGSESLIFYFGKNHDKKHSLVIIPLDVNNKELPRDATIGDKANVKIAGSEVGGGKTIKDFEAANATKRVGEYNLIV